MKLSGAVLRGARLPRQLLLAYCDFAASRIADFTIRQDCTLNKLQIL